MGQKHQTFWKFRTSLPRATSAKSSQHVRACAAHDAPICSEISKQLSCIIGAVPKPEMARAYDLRPAYGSWFLSLVKVSTIDKAWITGTAYSSSPLVSWVACNLVPMAVSKPGKKPWERGWVACSSSPMGPWHEERWLWKNMVWLTKFLHYQPWFHAQKCGLTEL